MDQIGGGRRGAVSSDEVLGIWRDFLTETEEHLEIADTLLSRGGAAFSRDDLATLFRAFHSLKGLSQAMDLSNMQAVAHHAEDLLGVVRDGRASLDEPKTTMLLEVVDRLRRMREWAETYRADAAPDADLVGRLAQLVQASEPAEMAMAVAGDTAAPLTEDEDMLAIYCELLAERVPVFVEAVATGDGAATAEGAEELVYGAEVIGLEQLANDLRAIAGLARTLDDDASRSTLLLALTKLREQLSLLEELSGAPAGAEALATALEAHARHDAAMRVAVLRAELNGADHADQARLNSLVGIAAAARSALDAGGMPQAAAALLLLEDQILESGAGRDRVDAGACFARPGRGGNRPRTGCRYRPVRGNGVARRLAGANTWRHPAHARRPSAGDASHATSRGTHGWSACQSRPAHRGGMARLRSPARHRE